MQDLRQGDYMVYELGILLTRIRPRRIARMGDAASTVIYISSRGCGSCVTGSHVIFAQTIRRSR